MTHPGTNKDPALFFADLEQQAGSYPVRSVKITARDRSLLGLFLMDDDAEATEVEAALTELAGSFNGKGTAAGSSFDPTACTMPSPDQLKKILRAELDRVQLTRLPCSLILLATGNNDEKTAAISDAIKECLHHVDILVRRSEHEFAVILPGTNLGKAILRAKTIRTAILASNADPRLGIALCYANDRFSPGDLLAQAEAELARTKLPDAEPICHVSGIRAEDACQVSVEERAQLFGFLVKDTN